MNAGSAMLFVGVYQQCHVSSYQTFRWLALLLRSAVFIELKIVVETGSGGAKLHLHRVLL